MKVKKLMTRDVRTCMPDESLAFAAREMWEGDCGALPVVDESHRVVGMITDRDVCMAVFLNHCAPDAIAVRDVMTSPVHCCRTDDRIDDALDAMGRHRVRRLPVTEEDGTLLAILSMNDILLAAGGVTRRNGKRPSRSAVLETLCEVCEHTGQEVLVP